MTCLERTQLRALAEDRLDPPALEAARKHLDECESCSRAYRDLEETWVARPSEVQPVDGFHLERGATLGRYVILHAIDAGGMGQVYAAYDPELDRKVAVKILIIDAGEDASAHEIRLLREARAMARLSHPHVVAVHDVGIADGRVFLTMEFVQGTTLKVWQREKSHPWRETRRIYLAAGRGLAAAHEAGLVHRDIKPSNVLMSHTMAG